MLKLDTFEVKSLSVSHAPPGQVIPMDGEGLSSGKEKGWHELDFSRICQGPVYQT